MLRFDAFFKNLMLRFDAFCFRNTLCYGVIANWLRRVDTINFLSLWESMNNENFKPTDFEGFRAKPGENAFTLSSKKWIELTNAIGLRVKSGKIGGGTFAHHDIALEFGGWISPEVKLYIIKEFKRLKIQENEQLEWEGKRFITKLNYLIQTEAIKEHLIMVELNESQKNYICKRSRLIECCFIWNDRK